MQHKAAVLIGIGVIALFGAYQALPRGIRNHNPLNIRFNPANNWQGQKSAPDDAGFVRFTGATMGIRAGAKLLRNYQNNHHLNTLQAIIFRFAPPFENNTSAYVDSVARRMGKSSIEYINLGDNDTLASLVSAMIYHENGINPYPQSIINEAVSLI